MNSPSTPYWLGELNEHFPQLPILEVDGVTIAQSMAISRYLARETGLAGTTNLVMAQVDEAVDVINDVQNAIVSVKQFDNQFINSFL